MIGNLPALTDAIQEAICLYIRYGTKRESAARLVGVSPRTLCRWMRCGKQGAEPYVQFRQAVLTAEASAEVRMVTILFQAATKNAAYARWWLERKCASRWSKSPRLARLEKLVEQLVGAVHAKLQGQGGTSASGGFASAGAQRGQFDLAPKCQD